MELESVQSLLAEALLSLMKRRAWPDSPARRKWRIDAADVLVQAQRRYRPSMTRSIDLASVPA
jgi:hypothetical protein